MTAGRLAVTVHTPSWLLLVVVLLHGCAGGSGQAPVYTPGGFQAQQPSREQRSRAEHSAIPDRGYHVVSRGDTLYAIAWRYRLDYRNVARWNNIQPPYTIYPGDKIRLQPQRDRKQPSAPVRQEPDKTAQVPSPPLSDTTRAPSPPIRPSDRPEQKPSAPQRSATRQSQPVPRDKAPAPRVTGPVKWSWPTQGPLLHSNSPTAEKGIKIGGQAGQKIHAAAPGQVVYSGSGLIGYGKLIIIKHNDTYLSAYAHNNELLVKEGDSVNVGQEIATMGATSDGRAALHFEIRRDGQPIDPLKHLPERRG